MRPEAATLQGLGRALETFRIGRLCEFGVGRAGIGQDVTHRTVAPWRAEWNVSVSPFVCKKKRMTPPYTRNVVPMPSDQLTTPGAARSTVLITRMARAMRRQFERAVAPLGLRARHLVALTHLKDHGPSAQQTLIEALGLDASNLVALLNELEDADLIVRSRDRADRRRGIIELSAEGERLLDGGRPRARGGRRRDPRRRSAPTSARPERAARASRRRRPARVRQGSRRGVRNGRGVRPAGVLSRREHSGVRHAICVPDPDVFTARYQWPRWTTSSNGRRFGFFKGTSGRSAG